MLDVRPFGFFGPEKLPAGGKVEKELADFEGRSRGASRRFDFMNFSAADDYLRSFRRIRVALASCEGKAAHTGNARQRFATETHCRDRGQIFGALYFAGGMAFEAKQRVIAAHADAVISDSNQASAAGLNFDDDSSRLSIESIFNQLLDDAGGPFYDFPCGDLIRDVVRKQADAVHVSTSQGFKALTSPSTVVGDGQSKRKDCSSAGLIARRYPAAMVFYDAFANGKAQAMPCALP